jgi:hypothetical protein
LPTKIDYRMAEELECGIASAIAMKEGGNCYMSSSKRLRGRNTSIYFSFDAEKASNDIIPE